MNQSELEGSRRHRRQIGSKNVGIIMVLGIFLLPAYFGFHVGRVGLVNYFWHLQLAPTILFELYPLGTLLLLPFVYANYMRFLFAYQMVKLYEGRTTGRWVYLIGLLSIAVEVLIFSVNVVAYVIGFDYHYTLTAIPSFLLLLLAFALVLIFPPEAGKQSWIEMEPTRKWWK